MTANLIGFVNDVINEFQDVIDICPMEIKAIIGSALIFVVTIAGKRILLG